MKNLKRMLGRLRISHAMVAVVLLLLSLAAYERAWSYCGSVTLEGKQHSVVF